MPIIRPSSACLDFSLGGALVEDEGARLFPDMHHQLWYVHTCMLDISLHMVVSVGQHSMGARGGCLFCRLQSIP